MKFTEHLSAHLTPEWRKQYIRYEYLKDLIYQALENAPQPEGYGEQQISRYFAKFEERFFQVCDKELSKVNTFFSEKEAEASRTFAQLQDELRQVDLPQNQQPIRRQKSSFFLPEPINYDQKIMKSHKRKIADLKLAFTEFYLSLILVQNYQSLNFTGFRKILKKHDKLMTNNKGMDFRCSKVETAPFYTSKQIDNIIADTEMLYINDLEAGNRQRAMNKLRVPPFEAKQMNWTTFLVGLYSGFFIILLCLMLSGIIVTYLCTSLELNDSALEKTLLNATDFPIYLRCNQSTEDWKPALQMYRGMFLIIFIIFLLGINTYGWRKAGVNHVLIFELDPRNNLSYQELLEVALFLGVLWASNVLAFIICYWLQPSRCYWIPLVLAGVMAVFLLNPTRTLKYKARIWLLKNLAHIVIAPFHPVGFADFWLADQLNSLQRVLLDFEFMMCYYICLLMNTFDINCSSYQFGIRAIVASLPAWFRFAQCLRRYYDSKLAFPHLVNAGKYSTTFFVVLFTALRDSHEARNSLDDKPWLNPYLYLFLMSASISSCYTLTWDIKMDWGLLEQKAPNKFLREEVVYSETVYYLAMVEDLILRFAWVITLSNQFAGFLDSDILVSILAVMEVTRRFVWNFFRLENEHLNNCGMFRAVRDISIKPAKSNENNPAKMEEMMDSEDHIPIIKNKQQTEHSKRRRYGVTSTNNIPQTMQLNNPPENDDLSSKTSVTFYLGDDDIQEVTNSKNSSSKNSSLLKLKSESLLSKRKLKNKLLKRNRSENVMVQVLNVEEEDYL